jgi:multiple sugar transport system permease protein
MLRKGWRISLRTKEALTAYTLLLPWILGFVIFTAGPVLASLALSFTSYKILSPPRFVGLENYKVMFSGQDDWWLKSLKVTVYYTFVGVPLQVILGYALALLLNQKVRGLSFWRTAFYMPAVVPAVAAAYVFAWTFDSQLGLVNGALRAIGIQGPKWFGSPDWVIPTFIILSLWGVGGGLVLYLSALQGVPTALYDAAKVDGANAWQRFWNVTLPMTSPVILFVFMTGIINSFQVFTGAYVITSGGPADASLFYVLYLYRAAFNYLKMGYGATMAVFLFVVLLALTVLMLRLSGRLVYYEVEEGGV